MMAVIVKSSYVYESDGKRVTMDISVTEFYASGSSRTVCVGLTQNKLQCLCSW